MQTNNYGIIDPDCALHDILPPLCIKSFINWIPEYSEQKQKILKRPIQRINDPSQHMTFAEAYAKSPRVGLVCNNLHQIIALDLDNVDLKHFAPFLEAYPTYVEQSPSSKPGHYRILYQVDSVEDKNLLRDKAQVFLGDGHCELYNKSKNYVTLTGKILDHRDVTDYISVLPPAALTDTFPAFRRTADSATIEALPNQPLGLTGLKRQQIVDPLLWVSTVPCEEFDPVCQLYMHKHGIIYHDYWLKGIMALHKTFGPLEGFEYADKWSAKSSEYDHDELRSRWQSLSLESEYELITEGTYQFMFNECVIPWRVANKAGTPAKNEYANTLAFLDYHGINIEVDSISTQPFLTGPTGILVPRYYPTEDDLHSLEETSIERISSIMTEHTREFHYMPVPSVIEEHLMTIIRQKIPRFDYKCRLKLYLDELPAYDPKKEPDYLTLLARDIIQRDTAFDRPSQEFHEILVRKWMLSLGRSLYSSNAASSEGMLILHGPQRIGKSSLGPRLLPKPFQHLHVAITPNFSGRKIVGMQYKDYKAAVCTKLIVDYDEAERIFDSSVNTEADIKNEITATVDTFRPAWGRQMLSVPRKYSVYASTNERRLQLPHEGCRRYWWLNVSYIDTYLLDEWPVDRMWKQIEYELSRKSRVAPWLLNEEEEQYLTGYLNNHRVTTDLEEILLDMYDWSSAGYKNIHTDIKAEAVMKTGPQIAKEMVFAGYQKPKLTALHRSLQRLCNTHAPKALMLANTPVSRGYLERNRQRLYLVPSRRSHDN